MKSVYLFQPQYAVEYGDTDTYYLPYSAGCLWSFASTHAEVVQTYTLQELGFRREDPADILKRMQLNPPAVCGFSCYIWNKQYCLTLAQRIKRQFPTCKIVFGGADTSTALNSIPYIDHIILGEGEESFVDVLLNTTAPRIYPKSRMTDLDFPSPYQLGIFDELVAQHPSVMWSMTLETNRGCPFSCTFCDWGQLTYSKIRKFSLDRVRDDIEWAAKHPVNYIFCADANFGIFKERDIEIAQMIRDVCEGSHLDAVNLQFAKNSNDAVMRIAQILGEWCRGITVSVQSMNPQTLTAIKRRNMDINRIDEVISLARETGLKTYTEVILGLPHETLESWNQGLCDILAFGQHDSIDVWFTNLLENAELTHQTELYNIDSVQAEDYFALYNERDWQGCEEQVNLVRSTHTMSESEMCQAYMYGWLIIHWHCAGYSQWIARRLVQDDACTYRDYYDLLLKRIQSSPLFATHFRWVQQQTAQYLRTGRCDVRGHALHSVSFDWMYRHKAEAYQLAIDCAESFAPLETEDVQVQTHFLWDQETTYPVQCGSYTVVPRTNSIQTHYALRRQGKLKCRIQTTH